MRRRGPRSSRSRGRRTTTPTGPPPAAPAAAARRRASAGGCPASVLMNPLLRSSRKSSAAGRREGKKKKKKAVREDVFELYAMRSVPLDDFVNGKLPRFPLAVSSVSERAFLKHVAPALDSESAHDVQHFWQHQTQRQCGRLYPSPFRFASDNYDPLIAWRMGVQMAALNFKVNDLPLQLNTAFFRRGGGMGYVRKPLLMRECPDDCNGVLGNAIRGRRRPRRGRRRRRRRRQRRRHHRTAAAAARSRSRRGCRRAPSGARAGRTPARRRSSIGTASRRPAAPPASGAPSPSRRRSSTRSPTGRRRARAHPRQAGAARAHHLPTTGESRPFPSATSCTSTSRSSPACTCRPTAATSRRRACGSPCTRSAGSRRSRRRSRS